MRQGDAGFDRREVGEWAKRQGLKPVAIDLGPAGAVYVPVAAVIRSAGRPCFFTCSIRVVIEVCGLASGTSTMPAATGFRSM